MTKSQRGMALITALMLLSFLTIVGAALLSSTTVDIRIGMNYWTNAQLLMLTESGIEAARESFRSAVEAKIDADAADTIDTLSEGITAVLEDLDGTDALLSASLDVDTLDVDALMDANATDDIRYGDSIPLLAGNVTIGTYTVFIRNDVADGATSTTDTNEVVTIVSIGVIDNSEMLIEVDIKKNRYPDMPAALTLNGNVPNNAFGPGSSNGFSVAGNDAAGGSDVNAVGVISASSGNAVSNDITQNPDRSDAYCGSGTTFTEPCNSGAGQGPDIDDISSISDPSLSTVSGLNSVVSGIESFATSTSCPSSSTGSEASPEVIVVSGDCSISGNTTGWGLLVVKGALSMGGSVVWNGLVMVVDPAECDTTPAQGTHYAATLGGGTQINGGLFIASTYNNTLNDVCINMNGGGTGGVTYDSAKISNASGSMPFTPIAITHF